MKYFPAQNHLRNHCGLLPFILSLIFVAIGHAAQFEVGDILFRDGLAGWENTNPWGNHIGHAGVFIGYVYGDATAMVVEAVPDSENPPGVRRARWVDFVANEPYYGNRTTTPEPTASQRKLICDYAFSRIGVPYDGNHLNQKGPTEYDCVGLTEASYESVGLNPTPNQYETDIGWPLTPLEQYEHTISMTANNPSVLIWNVRTNREVQNGGIANGNNIILRISDGDYGSGLRLVKVLKDDPTSGQEIFSDENYYEYEDGDFIDGFDKKWKTYHLPTGLSDGTYYVNAFDGADGHTSVRFTIDTTTPTLVSVVGSNNQPVTEGSAIAASAVTVTAADSGSKVAEIAADLQRPPNTHLSRNPEGGVPVSPFIAALSPLSDGPWCVKAKDAAGNVSSSLCFTVDITSPTHSVTTSSATIFVSAADSGSGIFAVAVYDAETSEFVRIEIVPDAVPRPQWSTQFTGMADGTYIVSSFDMAGNSVDKRVTVCTSEACAQDPCQNQNQQQCQITCEQNTTACTNYCEGHPESLACQTGCKITPNAPKCREVCADHPEMSWCQCDPRTTECNPPEPGPPPGPPNLCTIWPHVVPIVAPGGECHGVICSQVFYFGCPDTYAIIGGAHVEPNNFTAICGGDVGAGGIQVRVTYMPSRRSETVDITNGMCSADPTFIGGNLINRPLPEAPRELPPAFSPGVPGSPRPTFNGSYTVLAATAPSVSIFIRDASGALVRSVPSSPPSPAGGEGVFTWDGKNDQGTLLPEGLYAWHVAQRDGANLNHSSIQSGPVAIDNTPPVAQLSQISISPLTPALSPSGGEGSFGTILQINGTASDRHLSTYALDLATAPSGPFTPISSFNQNIVAGELGVLETSSMADGTYWVRLTVADSAALVSTATTTVLVNHTPSGTGVRLIVGATTQVVLNADNSTAAAGPMDNPNVFVDEQAPAVSFNWTFVPTPALTGGSSHTDLLADGAAGARLHYFIQATPGYTLQPGDNIVQYVYLDPAHRPSEILLGLYTGAGDGEHRVYWGDNSIQTGGISGPALLRMGDLPPAGQKKGRIIL